MPNTRVPDAPPCIRFTSEVSAAANARRKQAEKTATCLHYTSQFGSESEVVLGFDRTKRTGGSTKGVCVQRQTFVTAWPTFEIPANCFFDIDARRCVEAIIKVDDSRIDQRQIAKTTQTRSRQLIEVLRSGAAFPVNAYLIPS